MKAQEWIIPDKKELEKDGPSLYKTTANMTVHLKSNIVFV